MSVASIRYVVAAGEYTRSDNLLWDLLIASGATIRTLMHGNDKVNAIAVDTWETPLESKIPLGKISFKESITVTKCNID